MSYREVQLQAENSTLTAREADLIKLCGEQEEEIAKLRSLLVGLYSESYIESVLARDENTDVR